MRKQFTALLLAGLFACGLAACGERENLLDAPKEGLPGATASVFSGEEDGEDMAMSAGGASVLSMEIGTLTDQQWNMNYGGYLVKGSFSRALLRGEDVENYPALADGLGQYWQEAQQRFEAAYGELSAEAESDWKASSDSFYGPYYRNQNVELHRADSTAVSLLTVGEQFEGGTHSWGYYESAVFDTGTGNRLALSDVVVDMEAFREELARQVAERYPDADEAALAAYAEDADGLVWTLEYQGLAVYLAAGEIGSYADGPMAAIFPFDSMGDLFDEAYATVPERYAIPMGVNSPLPFDLAGDGSFSDVTVFSDVQDEANVSVTVTAGDQRCTQEVYAYSLRPTLVHMGDGENYLYVEAVGDNDYRSLLVFGLAADAVTFLGTYEEGAPHASYADNWYLEDALTDPDAFVMDTHLDILSSTIGTKPCHVGADGMPVAETEYYTIVSDLTLTSLTEVPANLLDAVGVVTETTVGIPAGTTLTFLRSDGASYVDMKLGDGREVRLAVDRTDWPQTVNGMNLETVFEGTVFAG